jgi:hypothetical protein
MSDFGTNPPEPNAAYPVGELPSGTPIPTYSGGATGNSIPSPDERTMAMLAELLQLFSWMIGPLILFLVKRDSAFVRFHALQAMAGGDDNVLDRLFRRGHCPHAGSSKVWCNELAGFGTLHNQLLRPVWTSLAGQLCHRNLLCGQSQ